MRTIDFSGDWDAFWSVLTATAGIGTVFSVLNVIGVLLCAYAIADFCWIRMKNRGASGRMQLGSGGWWLPLTVVGLLLVAPSVLIPMALTVVDVVANAGLSIWSRT